MTASGIKPAAPGVQTVVIPGGWRVGRMPTRSLGDQRLPRRLALTTSVARYRNGRAVAAASRQAAVFECLHVRRGRGNPTIGLYLDLSLQLLPQQFALDLGASEHGGQLIDEHDAIR
jgi:hypothetical protein